MVTLCGAPLRPAWGHCMGPLQSHPRAINRAPVSLSLLFRWARSAGPGPGARPPGMCSGVWLGSFRRRWIRAGVPRGRCQRAGRAGVLAAGGVSAADGRSGGPGARRSGGPGGRRGVLAPPWPCRCRGEVPAGWSAAARWSVTRGCYRAGRGLPQGSFTCAVFQCLGCRLPDRRRCAGSASPAPSAGGGPAAVP
jgi:hypothetical protein